MREDIYYMIGTEKVTVLQSIGHRSFLGSSRSSDRVAVELRVFQSVCILYIEGVYSVCILYIQYISEFAHMIMEAVRSPELQSVNQRFRRATKFHSLSESEFEGRKRLVTQLEDSQAEKKILLYSAFLFYSGLQQIR